MRPGRAAALRAASRWAALVVGGALAALALEPARAAAEPESKPWTLEALLAAAQAADPRVLAAAAEVARQRAIEAQARGLRSPRVRWWIGAVGPVGAIRNDPDRLDASQAGLPLRDDPGLLSFTGHLGANLEWPIYGFGRLEASARAASQGVAASAEAARAARQAVARDVTQVFWDYQLARRTVTALEDLDRQLAAAHERLEHLAKSSSKASRQDLAQLELVRAELAVRKADTSASRDVALETARVLAGVATEAPFALAPAPLEAPTAQPASLAKLTEAALARRAEVIAAQAQLRSREAAALARRRALFPELVAHGFADGNWTPQATPATNPFAWDPYNHVAAGLGLALRGSFELSPAQGEAAEAEAEVERARAALEQASRTARLEVARAHAAVRAVLERAARLRDEEAAAKRWFAEAEQAFDAGQANAETVLLAGIATARTGTERLAAGRDAQVALADLALATGEEIRPPARQ
jgi:outer membrane protein TolC